METGRFVKTSNTGRRQDLIEVRSSRNGKEKTEKNRTKAEGNQLG